MSQPITATAVNELRKRTDVPMMECKSALIEAGGDMEKAVEIIRVRFKGVGSKRALNETAEGRIAVHIDAAAKVAAIVDMRCESAPTAKNDRFIALANDIAKQVAQKDPKSVEELLTQPFVGGKGTVTDRINEVLGLIRENMKPYRFVRLAGGAFGEYIHHDGSVGVLLQVEGAKGDTALLRDICMHIAAAHPTPVAARREEVPAEVVAKEKEIAKAKAEATGKPANIAERIAEGQMKTWFGENVLVEQPYVKDPSKTVGDILKAAGLEVKKFVRYKVGEVV
jgi:elongation factor Ts